MIGRSLAMALALLGGCGAAATAHEDTAATECREDEPCFDCGWMGNGVCGTDPAPLRIHVRIDGDAVNLATDDIDRGGECWWWVDGTDGEVPSATGTAADYTPLIGWTATTIDDQYGRTYTRLVLVPFAGGWCEIGGAR